MPLPAPLVAPRGPVAPNVRGLARLVVFGFATLAYCLRLAVFERLRGRNVERGLRERQRIARAILDFLGVQIDVQSGVPARAGLIVPNHRSYIDVALVLGYVRGTIVSKSEVARWPLLGTVARATATVFVTRDSKESRAATRKTISEVAASGLPVILFAEGTTGIGPGLLPLKPGAFEIASEYGLGVLPLALEYEFQSDSWVGDDTFVRHFLECFSKRRTRVAVRFGRVATDPDSVALRHTTAEWLERNVLEMRAGWDARRGAGRVPHN